MPEFDTDTLLPPKHGVMTPFAKFAWAMIGFLVLALAWATTKRFRPELFNDAGDYVKSARTAMAAKDLEQAAIDLSKAYQRAPNNREVIRQIIEFMKTAGTSAADLLAMIERLNIQERPSPELDLLMAQTLLRLGRVTETRQAWAKLPETVKSGTEALELMAGILNAEGRPKEAAEFARRTVLSMPDSPEKEFQLAIMDIRHPFLETQQKARLTLWKLAESKESNALRATAQLAADPALTESEARRLLVSLDTQSSKPPLTLRLEVVSALTRARPDLRNTLCRAEMNLFRQSTRSGLLESMLPDSKAPKTADTQPNTQTATKPSLPKISEPPKAKAPTPKLDDELSVFCRWLAEQKQHALLLELAPLKRIRESTELFTCLARALAEDQCWAELKTLLSEGKPPVNPIRVSLWLAAVASHLQPASDESRNHLATAIDAASKKKDTMLLIAAALAAEQLNEQALSLAAYQAIASFDEKRAVATLEEAYAKAEFLKDTNAMLSTAAKLQTLRPENQAFADRLAYLQLLCGRDMEIAKTLESRTESLNVDGKVHYELLEALLAYRLADYKKLEQHLMGITQVSPFSVGQRAVYAGLLARTGRLGIAFDLAEKVPGSLLLPEELTLLKLAQ